MKEWNPEEFLREQVARKQKDKKERITHPDTIAVMKRKKGRES